MIKWKKGEANKENPFQLKFNPREKLITLLLFSSASIAIFVSIAIIYTLAEGSFSFFTDSQVKILSFFLVQNGFHMDRTLVLEFYHYYLEHYLLRVEPFLLVLL